MVAKMEIDVVIINFNYGSYLSECIESVLGQSVAPKTIIVVDDGSTDNSVSIIESYGVRITAVLQENLGHVAAVNAGFAVSTADACIFLDADDLLYRDCLKVVLAAWRPNDVKVQFRLDTIDREGRNEEMPFPYFGAGLSPEAVRAESLDSAWYPWTVSSGSVFCRRFLTDLLPIDRTRVYRSPDGYLSKLSPLFGDVRSLPQILGAYRVHGSNAWARGKEWSIETALRWLNFEIVLQEEFEKTARMKGIVLKIPFRPSFQQLEYRLLAFRFARGRTPFPGDTHFGLAKECLLSSVRARNSRLRTRMLWLVWLLLLNVGPKYLLVKIVQHARGQTGRAGVVRRVLSFARGQAEQKSAGI
ncbi:glycosyltransferase [Caulobacter sp. FWC2]|uniref:glycosyltransferase family 2 protein n=1 Tax=Caulobacter sp. FWC2 TaxID=69664 RepID=UPI000C15D2A0|nr:glycosyltransferase [Caulobacter sp. FWC2]PIB91618.1 glycosyl transferase [Caulobacter sp. FWC2]